MDSLKTPPGNSKAGEENTVVLLLLGEFLSNVHPRQPILLDFATEISMDSLVKFWHECTRFQFFGPDKEFDLNIYQEVQQVRVSCLVLAMNYLFKGQDNEAVCMVSYSCLLEQIPECGPEYILSKDF